MRSLIRNSEDNVSICILWHIAMWHSPMLGTSGVEAKIQNNKTSSGILLHLLQNIEHTWHKILSTPFSRQKEKLTDVSMHLNSTYLWIIKMLFGNPLHVWKCIFERMWINKFAIQTYECTCMCITCRKAALKILDLDWLLNSQHVSQVWISFGRFLVTSFDFNFQVISCRSDDGCSIRCSRST